MNRTFVGDGPGLPKGRGIAMPSDSRYFFLLVSERSGSNLFLRMMHANPDCLGPAATHLVRIVCNNVTRYGDLAQNDQWVRLVNDVCDLMRTNFIHWESEIDPAEILKKVPGPNPADVIRHIYQAEMEAYGRKSVIIKENSCYLYFPFILANFPGARFVYLVRDPRDMALSWKRITWWRPDNPPPGIREGATLWQENQKASLQLYGQLRDSGRMVLVRYEDLIQHPRRELERVCMGLGLKYSESMLNFHQSGDSGEYVKASNAFSNVSSPLNPDNLGKYREGLSNVEVRWIEHLCRREMALLGYRPEHEPCRDFKALDEELVQLEQRESRQPKDSDPEEDLKRKRRFETLRGIFTREEIPFIAG